MVIRFRLIINVKIKSDKEEIMNALVNIKLTNNFEKKLANLDINFDDNNGSVINFNSLMEENRTYLKLNDIFDKYYYLDEDNSLLFEDSEIVDDSKLIKVISHSFSIYFTDDNFLKENVDDNVKITVGLSDNDFYDLINVIINDLKNSKVLEVYASEFDSNYNIVLRINELTISDYVKLNINDNKEILEIDKENSKKIDDITAEKEEQIYNKFFEIPLISSYINMYDNMIKSSDLNYDLSTEM